MNGKHLIKPVLDFYYPTVASGKGIYLYDTEGKTYIDGCSGAVTASIGHGVPEIVEAMKAQAEKVSFVYRSQFTNEPAERLARKLSELSQGHLNWSFFVSSGSEATETAMKVAIQHWQEQGRERKNRFISRWMSYHGITMGALSMSGNVQRRKRFIPLLKDYPSVPAPYCYRCPLKETYPGCGMMCTKELETSILRIGPENVAGFIAEPVIGASGGAVAPPEGYYQEIKRICDKYDILFIADEVMTGIGRTGKTFAMEHWDVMPDIVALGKGMSAGYTPMAATLVSDKVMDPIIGGSKSIMAGHTYSANPQSAAVCLAVLEYIEKHDLVRAAEENGAYLFGKLREMASRLSIVGDVRGKGMLLGLELVPDSRTNGLFPLSLGVTARVVQRAFAKGLLVYSASGGIEGAAGDAIIVSPPLVITKEQIDDLVRILEAALLEIQEELQAEGHTQKIDLEGTADGARTATN